jgi:hypothetical protein
MRDDFGSREGWRGTALSMELSILSDKQLHSLAEWQRAIDAEKFHWWWRPVNRSALFAACCHAVCTADGRASSATTTMPGRR